MSEQEAAAPRAPLLPVQALARGLAVLRGRQAVASRDVADAALMTVDLREVGWAVGAGLRQGSLGEREAVLARCLAILAEQAEATPRIRSDAEALLAYLRYQQFDLHPCLAAAP